MLSEDECFGIIIKPAANIRIIKMLSEFRAMEEEQKAEEAQVETKNSEEKDVQAQEESKLDLEETAPQHEKIMQDLFKSMQRAILNKLDEIKAELSLEIKDIIKSQKDLGNQVQPLNPIQGEKGSLEGFFAGALTNSCYPVIVDHVTSGVNAVKKRIPQNILEQYPELPAALFTSPGPVSTLFETYSFLRDIPDIDPEQKAKSQILKILKCFRQVAEPFEHKEPKILSPATNTTNFLKRQRKERKERRNFFHGFPIYNF